MKKLAVCGKGGSGKSTVVSLLAKEISRRAYDVLVVDADESNLGLHRILGIDEAPVPIMDSVGGKKGIKEKLPPKNAAGLSRTGTAILDDAAIKPADIQPPFVARANGVSLVSIGKIHQAMEGCACPIGALGKEFLQKLELEEREVVLVDMEAGVEHFGRGVEAGVDGILIVVDPSFESLELAGRIHEIALQMGITRIAAVLNRVISQTMAERLREELARKNVRTAGVIHQDEEVFLAGLEGRSGEGKAAGKDARLLLDSLLAESGI